MVEQSGQTESVNTTAYNVCLLNPSVLPEWFWAPTAYQIEAEGHDCFIPDLRRGDPRMTIEDGVNGIEAAMGDRALQ